MEILGRTRDDAAGEAFDKAARALGFAYPGGAEIDRLAKDGDPGAVNFPRARLEKGSLDFSFSGLKTALIQYLEESGKYRRTVSARDVAASFQRAATDALAEKTMAACGKSGLSRLAVAGGVAANSGLRARLKAECDKRGIELFIPKPAYCTDNAAMIAAAAHFFGGESSLGLNAYPSLPL
jgi:N6-L-threonylcarbamoyladenine synthase